MEFAIFSKLSFSLLIIRRYVEVDVYIMTNNNIITSIDVPITWIIAEDTIIDIPPLLL